MNKANNNKNLICAARIIIQVFVAALLISCSKKSEDTVDEQPSSTTPEAPLVLWAKPSIPDFRTPEIDKKVEKIFLGMTTEEKIGQIIQAEIQAITPEQIKKYHIGSILNGGGSNPYRIQNASQEEWLRFADEYYEASMDTSDGKKAIPVFWGTDAVHGHGNFVGATLFPHNIGLGAANNPELIRKIGEVTAREVKATGIDWVFAPTVAVAQNDRWGRTYESYSEKVEIVEAYARAMVLGLQGDPASEEFLGDKHVAATAKHFLADGGTSGGDDQGNAEISEEELYTIHAPGYGAAMEAGVQSIMASFNSWNGKKIHGDQYLLNDVLKIKMGFEGLVVGDWNGHGQIPECTNASCYQALVAGIDLYMVPDDWEALYHNLMKQYFDAKFGTAELNNAVMRILRVKVMLGLFDGRKPSEKLYSQARDFIGNQGHRAIARQAVRESLVLLKNKNNLLPLSPKLNILVAGDAADDIGKQSGGWSVNWQGVVKDNSRFPGATSIFGGIKQHVEDAGGIARLSVDGDYIKKPDVAVVVFGENPYAEGQGDVDTLEYQPGDKKDLALLKKFQDDGVPVVSIFISGRPMWVNPEINASDAFVAAWLPGSEGDGIAEVILSNDKGQAEFDFKGRLSFSWPKLPTQEKLNPHHENYDPLFAYGYGLDYASGKAGPKKLKEKVPGIARSLKESIDLYIGKPMEPWRVRIRDASQRLALSGSHAEINEGNVKAETMDKDVQEDALRFSFNHAEVAIIGLEDGPALNLSHIAKADGAVSLDIQNIKFEDATAELHMVCGEQCVRSVPISHYLESIADKGWQNLQVKLSCFANEGDTFESMTIPFGFKARGTGEVGLANIRFVAASDSSEECPN